MAKRANGISRDEFVALVRGGRKLTPACLYERQDYLVDFGGAGKRPYRDITDEPDQRGRKVVQFP